MTSCAYYPAGPSKSMATVVLHLSGVIRMCMEVR